MAEYAVVKIGSSQYQVAVGDELAVEKLEGEKDKEVEFGEILLLVNDGKINIGRPFVAGALVRAEILGQYKGKKIRTAVFKAKSRYRRVKGHRKLLTKIKIQKIVQKESLEKMSVRKKDTKNRREKMRKRVVSKSKDASSDKK